MTRPTDPGPPTTTYSYTPNRRPALAESGIFSTTPSDLRTGTQFPVSSIQYQVSYTHNAANRLRSRPALAESGILSTPTSALRPPTSALRTGTQFPVSSIQYQVSHTYNARFTYSCDAKNRLSSVSALDPQSSPSSAVKIESTYNAARSRPALAESGIFSTTPSALRTGTQFPVSSIQYQVSHTCNAANRLLSSFTNPSNPSNPSDPSDPSDPLNQYFFDFRFSSEFLDQETGLVYYNYRYYSPELGRWLSRDPITEGGGWNLYAMSRNATINIADINGKGFWGVIGNLIAGAGAVSGAISGAITGGIAGLVVGGPVGAVAGLSAGASAGLVAGAISGAVSSGIDMVVHNSTDYNPINSATSGAISGVMAGGVAGIGSGIGAGLSANSPPSVLTHYTTSSTTANSINANGLGTSSSSSLWATTGSQASTTVAGRVGVPITGAAADAFSSFPGIGPMTGYLSASGAQSAGSGILNLTTGTFIEGGGINYQLLDWYLLDVGASSFLGLIGSDFSPDLSSPWDSSSPALPGSSGDTSSPALPGSSGDSSSPALPGSSGDTSSPGRCPCG